MQLWVVANPGSLFGRNTQYVLAESTRTLSLSDDSFEAEGDALWHGCGSGDKSFSLCEVCVTVWVKAKPLTGLQATVDLPMDTEENSILVVPDLSKHKTFRNRPYITGPPYWRFYAGAPIRTKSGVNIGSLCVLDDVVKGGLSTGQGAFLTTIADTVMRGLEMSQEAQERKKVTRMSRGLKAFVEGKAWIGPEILTSQAVQTGSETAGACTPTSSPDNNRNQSLNNSPAKQRHLHRANSANMSGATWDAQSPDVEETEHRPTHTRQKNVLNEVPSLPQRVQPKGTDDAYGVSSEEHHTSQDESEVEVPNKSTDQGLEATFVRAASLLREALDSRNGAAIFYDTVSGISTDNDDLPTRDTRANGYDEEHGADAKDTPEEHSLGDPQKPNTTYSAYDSVLRSESQSKAAKILGSSFAGDLEDQELYTKKNTRPVSERLLKSLLVRYPQGKLWLFDDDGSNLSADDESPSAEQLPAVALKLKGLTRKQTETKLLQLAFPGGGCSFGIGVNIPC